VPRTASRQTRPPAARTLLCLAGSLLLAACGAPPQPDVLLLITVDTLRADRLGAFGSPLGLTPNLDALAEESVVFTAAYAAAPFTLPSLSALMTGRYPQELGIFRNESALPQSVPTLASELRDRGWQTQAVVSNFILRRGSGIANGCDVFNDEFPQLEAVRKWPERIATDTTDAALPLLESCTQTAGARCFLWVHYQDPHGPYTPPGDLRDRELEREHETPDGKRILPVSEDHTGMGAIPNYQVLGEHRDVAFYRAGYHAEIRYLDEEVGRLLRGMESLGLAERTLVAFAADHGEGLGEEDYWFAHGEYLDDPQVRVPLFFRVPGRQPARRDDVAALTDVLPTLMAAVCEEPTEPAPAGRDLLAPGAATAASRPFLATLGGSRVPRFGLVEGEYEFVVSERDGVWDGRLTRRGHGEVDLAAAAPQIAGPMRRRLNHIRARMTRGRAELRQELSAQERESLRALGYVEGPEAR
jgi:arylsulfatase A-like enzyme